MTPPVCVFGLKSAFFLFLSWFQFDFKGPTYATRVFVDSNHFCHNVKINLKIEKCMFEIKYIDK